MKQANRLICKSTLNLFITDVLLSGGCILRIPNQRHSFEVFNLQKLRLGSERAFFAASPSQESIDDGPFGRFKFKTFLRFQTVFFIRHVSNSHSLLQGNSQRIPFIILSTHWSVHSKPSLLFSK